MENAIALLAVVLAVVSAAALVTLSVAATRLALKPSRLDIVLPEAGQLH